MLIRSIILFIVTCYGSAVLGQSRYNFFTISTEQGLSSPNIWSLSQDKFGYIWIGTTYGLNRYDGHSIRTYFHNDADKNSIPGNTVYWIYKDSDGEMWFACGNAGLARYNPIKDNFQSLAPYDSARKFNKYNGPVWRIGEDKQKRIYLSSGAACYRYDKLSGKFEELTKLFQPALNGGIGNFIMENKNIMWMPTDDGLYRYDIPANTIRKIDYDVQKLTAGDARIFDGVMLNDHQLLLTVDRSAYFIVDTKTFQCSPSAPTYNPSVTGAYAQMGAVLKDSHNRFWLSSFKDGLVEFFPASNSFYSLKKELQYPYPYAEQEGSGKSIFEDRDGNIWYGTSNKGVIRFQPGYDFISVFKRQYDKEHSLPSDFVSYFYQSGNNQTWIGTDRGVCIYDIANNRYTNYPVYINSGDYPAAGIRALVGNKESLFIATHFGFNVYKNGVFKRYYNIQDSNGKSGYSLFNNSLWLAACLPNDELILSNDSIARFNPGTGQFFYKSNSEGDPLYDFKKVDVIANDERSRTLWIEANDNELYAYNIDTHRAIRHQYYTGKDSIGDMTVINVDARGLLWIGTSKGIVSYDPVSHQFDWMPLLSSGSVRNIITADDKWVWFTNPAAISRYNRQTKKTETLNITSLLPNTTINRRAISFDSTGHLWIGTNQGFLIVDTARFHQSHEDFYPSLTRFKIFDKDKYFDKPYSETGAIELKYSENFFSFEFSSFNFGDNKGLRYAYMLEGFDKDWTYTTRNGASYTNVPAGTYTLRIKATNGFGEWQEMLNRVKIKIHPPFWKSTWFRILGVLLVAGICWWFYRLRKQAAAKRNIEKTIDYFANSVYGENSVNEICWDIARNCISQLQFEDCVVYLLDRSTNKLIQKAAYGPKNPRGHEIINPIEIEIGKGIVGHVAASGKPLLIPDTTKDARYVIDDEQRLSELAVPVLHDGKVIGVIDSEHRKKNFFTEEHVKAMTTIASISANKLAEAQAEAHAKENEIKLLEINTMLAESQLMALRAQMNPHFVFNCLNSIQECIVTKKYGEASNYLNKFSKLFRMVLNNSGRNLITIDEEKEVLELYLQLEEMRFENSFSYQIIIDEDLETEEILVPSMLLQPYVENALWHGLLHKQGERKLLIEFKKIDENIFRCTIDDNGIGRQQSFALKEKQSKAKRHESKGLKISRDRLDVLQKQGYHATLSIVDKLDEQGKAAGTAIIIELSTFLKN